MDAKEVGQRWSEYVNELFLDERPEICDTSEGNEGPEILESKVRWAMNDMKRGKVAGSDSVTIKMFKQLVIWL